MNRTLTVVGLLILLTSVPATLAQPAPTSPAKANTSAAEQQLIALSKDKWRWMAERNIEALDKLFAEEAVFVHMSRNLTKSQELEVIRSGDIQYKEAQIQEVSVRFVGSTAVLLNKIQLVAVVRGNDAVNPFNVTEVYVKLDGTWKLASLSFTRLLNP